MFFLLQYIEVEISTAKNPRALPVLYGSNAILFPILKTYYKSRKDEGLVTQSPAEKREDLYKLSMFQLLQFI